MPIFEYKCIKCGRISEFLESSGSKDGHVCVHCGSSDVEKQLSVFNAAVKQGQSKKCHGCSDMNCPHAGDGN